MLKSRNLGPLSTPRFVKSLVLEWHTGQDEWIRQSAEIRNLKQLGGDELWTEVRQHGKWLFVYNPTENVIYYEVRE